jgi:hypothetical protein
MTTSARSQRYKPSLRTLPSLVFRGMSRELLRLLRYAFRGLGTLAMRILGHPLTWVLPLFLFLARCSPQPGTP